MDIKQMNKERALMSLFLLLIISVIIFYLAQQESHGDIVSLLKAEPIYIFILITPFIFWFYFLLKGNSKDDLKSFIKRDLIKYISKFISLIIATFIAYFVLINHINLDVWDYLIEFILTIIAFALFLFACWFEETKFPELNKETLKKTKKELTKPFLVVSISLVSIFLILYFGFKESIFISAILSFLYFTCFFSAISPFPNKIIKKILVRLFLVSIIIAETYWAMKLAFLNSNTFWYSIIFVGGLTLLFSFISIFFENKTWFKEIIKGLFYEIKP